MVIERNYSGFLIEGSAYMLYKVTKLGVTLTLGDFKPARRNLQLESPFSVEQINDFATTVAQIQVNPAEIGLNSLEVCILCDFLNVFACYFAIF